MKKRSILKGAEFEARAYRKAGEYEKALLKFNESCKRVQEAGFERHPLPMEAFSLISAGLERKLSEGEQAVFEDMIHGRGEWFDLAVKVTRGKVYFFEVPRGRLNSNRTLRISGLKYERRVSFDRNHLPMEEYVDLAEIAKKNADVVSYLFSRRFRRLPSKIRSEGGIVLPSEGIVRPVGRGSFGDGFGIGSGYYGSASRGVRRVPAIAGAPEKAPSVMQQAPIASEVLSALKEGKPFTYQGIKYVPQDR